MRKKGVIAVLLILILFGLSPVSASDGFISLAMGGGLTLVQGDSLDFLNDPDRAVNLTLIGLGSYPKNISVSINFLGSIYYSLGNEHAEVKFCYTNPFFSCERWVDQNLRALVFAGPALGVALEGVQLEASFGPLYEARQFFGPYKLGTDDALGGYSIEPHYAGAMGLGIHMAASSRFSKKTEKGVAVGCLFGILSGNRSLKAAQVGNYEWKESTFTYLIHPYLSFLF